MTETYGVVIDMLNGFCKEGALATPSLMEIVPYIGSILKTIPAKNRVFLCDSHEVGDKEFETYPEHCIKGTKEAEIIDELKPYAENANIFGKVTTNGMAEKAIQEFVADHADANYIVMGCCTDICVKQFALNLMKYKTDHGCDGAVLVCSQMVGTFSDQSVVDATFDAMKKAGIRTNR